MPQVAEILVEKLLVKSLSLVKLVVSAQVIGTLKQIGALLVLKLR